MPTKYGMICATPKIVDSLMFSLPSNIKIEENKIIVQGLGKINTNS